MIKGKTLSLDNGSCTLVTGIILFRILTSGSGLPSSVGFVPAGYGPENSRLSWGSPKTRGCILRVPLVSN